MTHHDLPVKQDDMLGRVREIQRGHRVLYPRPMSLSARWLARVLCHCDHLRNLALRMHSLQQNNVILSGEARLRHASCQ